MLESAMGPVLGGTKGLTGPRQAPRWWVSVGFGGTGAVWDLLAPIVLDGTCSGSPLLPVYPLGFFLLQLANTMSAWLRMGGRPRACETSQKGTARFRGRT